MGAWVRLRIWSGAAVFVASADAKYIVAHTFTVDRSIWTSRISAPHARMGVEQALLAAGQHPPGDRS